jgi:hypothetical protein
MLSFGFIVIYNKFAAPLFGWPIPILEGEFWTLLQIGIGGYVVGRSAEKIADKINITKKGKPVDEQIQEYKLATGKSRSSFFRKKQKMKKDGML